MNKNYEKKHFSDIVKKSRSYTDVARKLNIGTTCGNRQTIKKYIKIYELDIAHFDFKGEYTKRQHLGLNEILVKNSKYTNTTHLKERLYREGLKIRICEKCGQDEMWNNEKISLILDHISGINDDNRLGNLRILCPNCNATLDTNGGKNIKNKPKKKNKKPKHCDCGREILSNANQCVKCGQISQRKVERPTYKQLLEELEKTNYCAVGRKYGVSDAAVRKWVKEYEKKLK